MSCSSKDNPDGCLPWPWDVPIKAVTVAPLGGFTQCGLGQTRGFLSLARTGS